MSLASQQPNPRLKDPPHNRALLGRQGDEKRYRIKCSGSHRIQLKLQNVLLLKETNKLKTDFYFRLLTPKSSTWVKKSRHSVPRYINWYGGVVNADGAGQRRERGWATGSEG